MNALARVPSGLRYRAKFSSSFGAGAGGAGETGSEGSGFLFAFFGDDPRKKLRIPPFEAGAGLRIPLFEARAGLGWGGGRGGGGIFALN